ncbi:hypothetical protein FHW69_003153 [Luteibacter sp. Sphag1AF]|uniref:hypothetical protein n=1 Tax=Luteibacter sp. Sphag1AF TaxID=2587031 RepID=UPI00161BE7D7|nr:hypothetical protein [Luteibacter sp. Sphag1AF]MBB3228511.1 hypothetical protein [Luteibacter sp. Sphag1AF]
MKPLLLLASMLLPNIAAATDTFDERVTTARQLEESPEGRTYSRVFYAAIGEQLGTAMRQCFPPESTSDTDRFTVVANVLSNGTAKQVEVRPETKMSACFRDKFAGMHFPSLPSYAGANGLPVFIDWNIKP